MQDFRYVDHSLGSSCCECRVYLEQQQMLKSNGHYKCGKWTRIRLHYFFINTCTHTNTHTLTALTLQFQPQKIKKDMKKEKWKTCNFHIFILQFEFFFFLFGYAIIKVEFFYCQPVSICVSHIRYPYYEKFLQNYVDAMLCTYNALKLLMLLASQEKFLKKYFFEIYSCSCFVFFFFLICL